MSYLAQHGTRTTSQRHSIPGSDQVENSAGGFAWQVDCWTRLRRFLILGSEGGSYYAGQHDLTRENVDALHECIREDGPRTVEIVASISEAGAAPKNDPAIFALAACSASTDLATRKAALAALPRVCRIGTHLFTFAGFVEQFRGWGRTLRQAVAAWYEREDVDQLAYQAIKYRQRGGWSHRDLLRLAHPVAPSERHRALYEFMARETPSEDGLIPFVDGYLAVNSGIPFKQVAEIVGHYNLPREALPSHTLNSPEVWEALLQDMPMTALVRNLATMTRVGLLAPTSSGTQKVLAQLADTERLRKSRIHPLAILTALATYASGQGMRSATSWAPVVQIVDALNDAFYASFGNVETTGKRWMLALDVSGSMGGGYVAGSPLTPKQAAAAMALVTANTESAYECVTFQTGLEPYPLSPRQRLDDIVAIPWAGGGTDCALPMLYATAKAREIDVFVVYTDSETWAGHTHPVQALNEYRRVTGIDAKLIVVGMVSNGFSIADPNDAGMLDVVGFDTATPQVMAEFAKGLDAA